MKKLYCAFLFLIALVMVSGCVSSSTNIEPASNNEQTKLFNEHMDRGAFLEKENNFKTAFEEYKLAATIDPDNPVAAQKIKDIETILHETAELHYQKGLELDKQGKSEMARKEYLAALQNWPDHEMARKIFTAGQLMEEKSCIVHTIRFGESISKLAIIYYGNYKEYTQIAKFNAMKDATQVQVGQKVLVPEVEGVTLADLKKRQTEYFASLGAPKKLVSLPEKNLPGLEPEKNQSETLEFSKGKPVVAAPDTTDRIENAAKEMFRENSREELSDTAGMEKDHDLSPKTPLNETDAAKESPPAPAPAMVGSQPELTHEPPEETFDDVQIYLKQGIELFDIKDYEQAIVELNLAKKADPDNSKVLDYLFQAHFQNGLVQHLKGEFLDATKSFEMARDNNPSCEQCSEYIVKSLDSYKEKHYTMGIYYFGKEQLKEAIAEWELVKAVDAGYKDVVPNLKKAEMLSQRLETIKKSDD